MTYDTKELEKLDKPKLIEIILEQERRLNKSQKGQARRDNLVGESFGALVVVGDAGNEQSHSTWHCRCSGNIYKPQQANVCDRPIVAWGSNLKANRQLYCGSDDCPAARQVLANKRQKNIKVEGFLQYLEQRLVGKYALMGDRAVELVMKDYALLEEIFKRYYGVNQTKQAYLIEEIEKDLGYRTITPAKKILDQYIVDYWQDSQ